MVGNLANLFKVKHIRVTVKHTSCIFQAPKLRNDLKLLRMNADQDYIKEGRSSVALCIPGWRPTTKKGTASAVIALTASQ